MYTRLLHGSSSYMDSHKLYIAHICIFIKLNVVIARYYSTWFTFSLFIVLFRCWWFSLPTKVGTPVIYLIYQMASCCTFKLCLNIIWNDSKNWCNVTTMISCLQIQVSTMSLSRAGFTRLPHALDTASVSGVKNTPIKFLMRRLGVGAFMWAASSCLLVRRIPWPGTSSTIGDST